MQQAPAARNIQLDFLRGIAVLLVICHHFFKPPQELANHWLPSFLMVLRFIGWVGVDLFFVLSGFLVSGLIFQEFRKHNQFKALRFLVRRGFKIYPAYYVSIIASLLLIPGGLTPETQPFLKKMCFFLQNYALENYTVFSETLWGHMWSLSVEEHFYFLLVFAFLIILKTRNDFKGAVPILCVFVCVIVLLLRHFACWGQSLDSVLETYYPVYMPTQFRIDALSFGVLLSYFHHFHREKLESTVVKFKWPTLIMGLVLVLPCALLGVQDYFTLVFGLTMLYAGFGLIMLVIYYAGRPIRFISPAVAKVGYYSYSIYIWHRMAWFAVEIFVVFMPLPYLAKNLFYFCLAIATGIIMGKLVEMPFLALRDKFFPSRSVV